MTRQKNTSRITPKKQTHDPYMVQVPRDIEIIDMEVDGIHPAREAANQILDDQKLLDKCQTILNKHGGHIADASDDVKKELAPHIKMTANAKNLCSWVDVLQLLSH